MKGLSAVLAIFMTLEPLAYAMPMPAARPPIPLVASPTAPATMHLMTPLAVSAFQNQLHSGQTDVLSDIVRDFGPEAAAIAAARLAESEDRGKIVNQLARVLAESFNDYYKRFRRNTAGAQFHFEERDWGLIQTANPERLKLYRVEALGEADKRVKELLSEELMTDEAFWMSTKQLFLRFMEDRYESDLAITFFYSVMRRAFATSGLPVEYSDDGLIKHEVSILDRPFQEYHGDLNSILSSALQDRHLNAPFRNLDEDVELASQRVQLILNRWVGSHQFKSVDFAKPLFFRNKGAYLVGRIHLEQPPSASITSRNNLVFTDNNDVIVPLILALRHDESGVYVNAVLMGEADASNLFTYARSSFHVDIENYRELVLYLSAMMPGKSPTDLYSSIGFVHPAKVSLVQSLRRYLTSDPETVAVPVPQNEEGKAMIVFSFRDFNYMFKIVRDIQKLNVDVFHGRDHVIRQYAKVNEIDRAGRMLDTMALHNLRIDKKHFSGELLDELLKYAPTSVRVDGDQVIFSLVYMQKRTISLAEYLLDPVVSEKEKREMIEAYGYAVKDLAAAGIFVNDYMVKNFGVTSHRRVLLYDFDDFESVLKSHFMYTPVPKDDFEEMSDISEWAVINSNDVLVDGAWAFWRFTMPGKYVEVLKEIHPELFSVSYWEGIQSAHRSGEVLDLTPYSPTRRLRFPNVGARLANSNAEANVSQLYPVGKLELSEETLRIYFGSEHTDRLISEGNSFYIRRIGRENDQPLYDRWKTEYASDSAWRDDFRKRNDEEAERNIPYFRFLPEEGIGLISYSDGEERLLGYVQTTLNETGYKDESSRGYLSIQSIEIYYKNIGQNAELPGTADILFDYIVLGVSKLSDIPGVRLMAETSGGRNFAIRNGFKAKGYGEYSLDRSEILKRIESSKLSSRLFGARLARHGVAKLASRGPKTRQAAAEVFVRQGDKLITAIRQNPVIAKHTVSVSDETPAVIGELRAASAALALNADTFDQIHQSTGLPLSDVPQDAGVEEMEWEVTLEDGSMRVLDLLKNTENSNVLTKFLEKGEGLHHVELWTPDLLKASQEISEAAENPENGLRVVNAKPNSSGTVFVIVTVPDGETSKKILVELIPIVQQGDRDPEFLGARLSSEDNARLLRFFNDLQDTAWHKGAWDVGALTEAMKLAKERPDLVVTLRDRLARENNILNGFKPEDLRAVLENFERTFMAARLASMPVSERISFIKEAWGRFLEKRPNFKTMPLLAAASVMVLVGCGGGGTGAIGEIIEYTISALKDGVTYRVWKSDKVIGASQQPAGPSEYKTTYGIQDKVISVFVNNGSPARLTVEQNGSGYANELEGMLRRVKTIQPLFQDLSQEQIRLAFVHNVLAYREAEIFRNLSKEWTVEQQPSSGAFLKAASASDVLTGNGKVVTVDNHTGPRTDDFTLMTTRDVIVLSAGEAGSHQYTAAQDRQTYLWAIDDMQATLEQMRTSATGQDLIRINEHLETLQREEDQHSGARLAQEELTLENFGHEFQKILENTSATLGVDYRSDDHVITIWAKDPKWEKTFDNIRHSAAKRGVPLERTASMSVSGTYAFELRLNTENYVFLKSLADSSHDDERDAWPYGGLGARLADGKRSEELSQLDLSSPIAFGTSGWRAPTDHGFTIGNVSRVAQAVANVLLEDGKKPASEWRVAVGYDARPGARDYAIRIVEVLTANGITTDFIDQVTPTPIMAEATRPSLAKGERYDLALHITASHNPVFTDLNFSAMWQGIKVLQAGIPASDQFTAQIAAAANDVEKNSRYSRYPFSEIPAALTTPGVDLISRSNERLRRVFDLEALKTKLAELRSTNPRFSEFGVIVDSMHGATVDAAKILNELGVMDEHLNTEYMFRAWENGTLPLSVMDPSGQKVPWRPEPQPFLHPKLTEKVTIGKFGAPLDGDGDRAAFIDIDGKTLTPNEIGLIFGHYLYSKGERGAVVRTIPTTHSLDRFAALHGLNLYETPVGSKWFKPYATGELEELLVGIEESGHIFFKYKNEIFADSAVAEVLLALEILIVTGKSLGEYLQDIYTEQGELVYVRTAVDPKIADSVFVDKLKTAGKLHEDFASQFAKAVSLKAGRPLRLQDGGIKAGVTVDLRDASGIKVNFSDGTWAMYRISGTDGSVRIYAEAETAEALRSLVEAVRDTLVELISGARFADGQRTDELMALAKAHADRDILRAEQLLADFSPEAAKQVAYDLSYTVMAGNTLLPVLQSEKARELLVQIVYRSTQDADPDTNAWMAWMLGRVLFSDEMDEREPDWEQFVYMEQLLLNSPKDSPITAWAEGYALYWRVVNDSSLTEAEKRGAIEMALKLPETTPAEVDDKTWAVLMVWAASVMAGDLDTAAALRLQMTSLVSRMRQYVGFQAWASNFALYMAEAANDQTAINLLKDIADRTLSSESEDFNPFDRQMAMLFRLEYEAILESEPNQAGARLAVSGISPEESSALRTFFLGLHEAAQSTGQPLSILLRDQTAQIFKATEVKEGTKTLLHVEIRNENGEYETLFTLDAKEGITKLRADRQAYDENSVEGVLVAKRLAENEMTRTLGPIPSTVHKNIEIPASLFSEITDLEILRVQAAHFVQEIEGERENATYFLSGVESLAPGQSQILKQAFGQAGILFDTPTEGVIVKLIDARDLKPEAVTKLQLPLAKLQSGDLFGWKGIVQMAKANAEFFSVNGELAFGKFQAGDIPENLIWAYGLRAGIAPDKATFKSIVSGQAKLEILLKYLLKPIVKIDLDRIVQAFRTMEKMVQQAA